MLAESVEFLQKFSPGGAAGKNHTIFECRTILSRQVENSLTDFSSVPVSLKRNGENSDCFTPLQFCEMFLRHEPEVFVTSPGSSSPSTPTLTQIRGGEATEKEQLTRSFLMWFLSRIVAVLGQKCCLDLHPRCLDIIHQICQTVKWKDHYLYVVLLKEFIGCLVDLVQINEKLFDEGYDRVTLDRFDIPIADVIHSLQDPAKNSDPVEVSLSSADLDVDEDGCELLQLNITKIIGQMSIDVSRLSGASVRDVLWGALSCHIEYGNLDLKTETLRIMSELFRQNGFPVAEVLDYFLTCMMALLELQCSGFRNEKGKCIDDLEIATADVFQCLMSDSSKTLLSDIQLDTMMVKMTSLLRHYGMMKLNTLHLKRVMCSLTCYIEERLGVGKDWSSPLKPYRSQLVASLICEIGTSCELEFLVKPLTTSVTEELSVGLSQTKDTKSLSVVGRKQSPEPGTSTGKTSLGKRKRKLDDSECASSRNVLRASKTWILLSRKLNQLIAQTDFSDSSVEHSVEGVKVILEIMATCMSLYNGKENKYTSVGNLGELCQLTTWLTMPQCQSVCNFMLLALQTAATLTDKRRINATVISVVQGVGSLLAVHDCAEFEPDILQAFTWMTSLPWLLNDPSWLDLKPANARDIVKISGGIAEHLDHLTTSECLTVLSSLPKEVASTWRVHIFRQALCDSDVRVKSTALKSFPLLLYHLGPNANHLVYDLIHPCMTEKCEEILETLAEIVGPLACIISRKAVLNRPDIVSISDPVYKSLSIGCTTCDSSLEDVSGSPRERPRLVDPNMFSPFLQRVHNTSQTVKLKLITSMKRMFGHIGVRKNNAATISVLNTGLLLIEDSNYSVRRAFSHVIQYLLGEEGTDDANELVFGKLREAFNTAQKNNNSRLQETVLLTIAQLGRVAEGEMLVTVIVVLLESMLSPTPSVASVAYEELKSIARHRKTKTRNLFMQCRLAVCKFLVEAMHDAHIERRGKSAEEILKEVARVLDFQDVKTFLTGTEKYIVPFLVSKGTAAASSLIKLIATHLSLPSRSKLLIHNTKYVFSHLVRFCQREADLQSAISYLQKETDFELRDLLRMNFQRVHNELLLHLSTHYTQVFNGLRILSSFDLHYSGPSISTNEEMATYLQPRLLGVLAHFDSQLLNSNVPMEEKRPALESLIEIIRLMGSKYISAIRHKVMNTLRIGLQFTDKEFMEISCRAWNRFVRSLELPFLGQMLPQIVATLLPLLKQLPKPVADIFNFMIVDNRKALRGHFQDIYFLPEMPELSDANAVLKETTDGPSSQLDFKARLEHCIRGVTHESLDVRLHALSKLRKLLREQREAMFQCVVGSETADPVVTKLVSVLLRGCREPDVRAQRLYAECLGKCSAIDPGRLELSSNNPRSGSAKLIASILDDNFAVGLINEMVKSFLAATEPRIQDCASYALQELLSVYHIYEATEGEPRGGTLWKRFPEHVQEILIPLVDSKYVLAASSDWSVLQKPIYCSKKGNTLKEWVSTWTGYLSSKVKQDKPHQVFKACSAVIKHDIHIALHILPYVVLHSLMDGSEQDTREMADEILEVLNQVKKHDTKQKSATNFLHMSAQTVFSVLDYLTKWKRFRAQIKAVEAAQSKASTSSSSPDRQYMKVNDFLATIPQDLLADVSFSCQAFTRALMHFEQFIQGESQYLQEHLDFMQRLYVAMDEPDGVLGVAAIRHSSPTLMEQVLTHGKLGQQHEMQACYEQAIQLEPDDVNHHQGLLRSILDLGQPSKALHHATGVIAERKEWAPLLNAYQVEAAWKLGDWSKLETFTAADKGSRKWSVVLGKILLAAKDKRREDFYQQLQIARQEQIGPLSAASMEIGSYQRGYEHIVRLHMLNEIEENMTVFMKMSPADNGEEGESPQISRSDLLRHSQTMLGMMQSSFRIQEPVLTLRRILLALVQQAGETTLDREIGQCWLWSAKIARKAGFLQTAYSSLLQANEYNLPEFCIEKAKWLWEKGVNDQALSLLERQMQVHFGDAAQLKLDNTEEGKSRRRVYAQVLLLYGRYSEETSNMESNAIVKQYKEVIEVNPQWEDGHFYLAKYFDKIMTTLVEDKDRPDISRQGEFVIHVVKNFGQSLHYGNQFIYQSLPRMLSLWLDFGTAVMECEKKEKSRPSQNPQGLQKLRLTLTKLNKMISEFGKKLPPYLLLSAFSQLLSRLCHSQPDVFSQLKMIIARLVVSFPQQSLWLLMAVSKSSYKMRENRCKEIFATVVEMKPNLHKLIQDFIKLTERLLELCEKDVPSATTLSMTTHFRHLKRLLDDSTFSQILLPLQSLMTVTLPNTTDSLPDHNPFPENLVYIKGFEDTIELLSSLQRPKKITMVGSDGNFYIMMCKPKDDLRKDCRLMEFNGIINKFLRKDPESRRRQLHIRTYTVIPLNEECGLLEWVNNTSGLRYILMKLYREKGMYTTGKELKSMMPALTAPIETKLQIYKQKLLPRHPPVFAEWFLRTFPDPTSWYNARLAYARTVAVMSVVGYILGLGDRHGENILFDSTCGDCVHVDFNCLFNRGETFEWPEKVPFRLTHNLVTAMGPLKLEGIFRRACEVTLRVMRDQMDPLMSVLKPFVYDPLVEWSKQSRGQRSNPTDSGEITNEQAMTHVQNIEHRLKGILKNKTKARGLALSVEGHVNYLIQDATDEKNLCQMYIGWAAYL